MRSMGKRGKRDADDMMVGDLNDTFLSSTSNRVTDSKTVYTASIEFSAAFRTRADPKEAGPPGSTSFFFGHRAAKGGLPLPLRVCHGRIR